MAMTNKHALFFENGKKKCWVIVMRFKRPFVPKKERDEENENFFNERVASEKRPGKIMFAIQEELERHPTYDVMIEGETYPFELQKIRKIETDDRAFFVVKGRLRY